MSGLFDIDLGEGETPIQNAIGLPSLGEWGGGLTGKTAAEASAAAGQLQAASAREALEYQKEKDALARQDLMPFTQAGMNTLPLYASLLNPANQESYLMNNPLFKAALSRSETGLRNSVGPTGLRGDLSSALTTNYLAQGNDFIDSALNRFSPLLQLGQASAAGQAANGLNSANAANELLTSGAASQAAGLVGAANAQQAGMGQTAGIAAGLLGAFLCDANLKHGIKPLYLDDDGLTLYEFKYVGHSGVWRGKMAQEIRDVDPDHVVDRNGVLFVSEKYAPVRVH